MNSNKKSNFKNQASLKNTKNVPSNAPTNSKSVLRPQYLLGPDKLDEVDISATPKPNPVPFCWGLSRTSNQKPSSVVQKSPINSKSTFVKLSSIVNKNQQQENKILITGCNDNTLKNENNILPKIAPNTVNGEQEQESKPQEESVVNCWESLASSDDDCLPETPVVKLSPVVQPSPVIKQFQWPVLTCEGGDWREKFASLSEQFRFMLYNNIRTDCTLVVGSHTRERFQCHKLQLCRASSVFDLMLYNPANEKGEISLTNIEPETFREVVEYIYTEQVDLKSAGGALSLCRAACFYKMSRLREACLLFLGDNLREDCLWPTLEFSLQGDETLSLREKCLQFVRVHTRSCLDTPGFMQIEQSTLAWLLQQEQLEVESEMDLINAATCWAISKTGGLFEGDVGGSNFLRESLGPSFSHLRFLSLSPEQFSLCLSDSELLSEREKFAILVNLVTPGTLVLPDGISNVTQSRSIEFQTEFPKMISNFYKCYRPVVEYNDDDSEENRNIQFAPLLVTTEFESNCDITLLGLEVTTQYNDKLPSNVSDNRLVAYQENIDLSVLEILEDFTVRIISQTNYNKSASYNCQVAIKLKEPVVIKKNTSYLLGVHYNCPGQYLDLVRVSHVDFHGKVLNFKYVGKDGLIETIIFS